MKGSVAEKQKVKNRLITVFSVILISSSIVCFLFPTVSNTVGKQIAEAEVLKFDEQTNDENTVKEKTYKEALNNGDIDDKGYPINESGQRTSSIPLLFELDLERLYEDSVKYNEILKINQGDLLVDSYSYVNPSIDLTTYGIYNGIYGYISAPTIDMKLPLYLGASEENMSYGAAHLTYTSLPIGGESTNCVIAGHTGYVGRIFFDNIRNLKIGDEITVTNYWDTLTYKVTDTEIYKPNQSNDIFIKPNRDVLTLITCVGNGFNGFDRYYVECERGK